MWCRFPFLYRAAKLPQSPHHRRVGPMEATGEDDWQEWLVASRGVQSELFDVINTSHNLSILWSALEATARYLTVNSTKRKVVCPIVTSLDIVRVLNILLLTRLMSGSAFVEKQRVACAEHSDDC